MATCRASASCNFTSRQAGGFTTNYSFYCTQPCSRWVLYMLDYVTPLRGCNYKLPCTVDSKSFETNSVTARKELNITSGESSVFLSVTTGRLMLVAHCILSSGYAQAVMIREDGSVPKSQPAASSTTCLPPVSTSSVQSLVPSPTATTPSDKTVGSTTVSGSSDDGVSGGKRWAMALPK